MIPVLDLEMHKSRIIFRPVDEINDEIKHTQK